MKDEKATVETEKEVKSHLVLSVKQPTPMWATWVFRAVYGLTFIVSFWVTSTQLIPQASKAEVMLILSTIDRLIWLGARLTGVKKDDITN